MTLGLLIQVEEDVTYCKGPRTQIIGFQGKNIIILMVLGPQSPITGVLGPLGLPMDLHIGPTSFEGLAASGYYKA